MRCQSMTMTKYQDIVDYYRIDKANGDSNTRSFAAILLYRLVRNILRHMGWPDNAGFEFGRFENATDYCRTTVTFTVESRAFPMTFAIGYIRPTDGTATNDAPEVLPWQLTIDKNPPLPYEPSQTVSFETLYDRASDMILHRALSRP